MGQRANLIVVSNENYELYYDHHCANIIDRYLFWGEDLSVDFFRNHERQDESAWLDTAWCEGGAVIDLHRKVLLFFGGEGILCDVALREVYLQLLQYMWPRYAIRWAHDGIVDLAEYVGVPREKVMSPASLEVEAPIEEELILSTFSPLRKAITFQSSILRPAGELCREGDIQTHFYSERICLDETEGICSLRKQEGEILLYSMEPHGTGLDVLLGGERLLESLKNSQPRESKSIVYLDSFPRYGIHIDLLKKELYFWRNAPFFKEHQLPEVWPGWKIIPWKGSYMRHAEVTNGTLQFPDIDIEKQLTDIERIVCCNAPEPVASALQTIEALAEYGFSVGVNSDVLSSENFECPTQAKEIFAQVKDLYLWSIG